MSWRLVAQYNGRDHWTIYLLATASNLFLSIPLYIAARAAIVALVPVRGSTYQFITAYGTTWGIALDFLWTLLVFQGILAALMVTMAGTTLIEEGWRIAYILSGLVMVGFVGIWLGARFVQALSWVSLIESIGINGSGVYSDLFWFGLGSTIFFVAMIVVLRKSYDKISEQRATIRVERLEQVPESAD